MGKKRPKWQMQHRSTVSALYGLWSYNEWLDMRYRFLLYHNNGKIAWIDCKDIQCFACFHCREDDKNRSPQYMHNTLQWCHNEHDGVSNHQPYSTVYSGADQIKHQSSASPDFVRGFHLPPVNSPHKGPVTRKMFPFDDVIMNLLDLLYFTIRHSHGRRGKWNTKAAPACLEPFKGVTKASTACHKTNHQWPLLLTWIDINPSMDK